MYRPKRPTDEPGGEGPPSRRGRTAVSPRGGSSRGQPSPVGGSPAGSSMNASDDDAGPMEGLQPASPGSAELRGVGRVPLSEAEARSSADRVDSFQAMSLLPSTNLPQPIHQPTSAILSPSPASFALGPVVGSSSLANSPAPSSANPTSSASLSPLLNLQADIYLHLFPFLPSRDLARLSQTSRFFRDRVAAWQGFNSVVVVTAQPASASSDYVFGPVSSPGVEPVRAVSGSLPPSYPFRGSITLGGKVYLPDLDGVPCCYVLDVATLFWSRHPLKIKGLSSFESETPQRPWSRTSSSTTTVQRHSAPSAGAFATSSSDVNLDTHPSSADPSPVPSSHRNHTGPVTGSLGLLAHDTPILYLFGGSRQSPVPSSSSPSSSPSVGSDPSTSEGSASSGSLASGHEPSSSLFKIDVATWELHDMNPASQDPSPSPLPPSGVGQQDDQQPAPRLWPAPRRNHSADVVRGRWLVIFGGLEARGSSGENDLWVYDLELHEWHHPDLPGWAPRPVFSHSSVNHKDDIFVFGGSQKDHPTNLVLDTLSRLSCVGVPSEWVWHSYRPSESFSYSRTSKSGPPRNLSAGGSGDSSSHDPASSQSESSSSGQAHAAGALSSSFGSSVDGRDPRLNQGSSGGSSSGSEGRTTTGSSPLERFQAGMMMLGADKLVILGGNTIEDGYDKTTGVPYDDTCTFNLASLDIFDFTRLHWSRIRPSISLDKKPLFFSEAIFAAIPPDLATPLNGWKILASGKALDLDDLHLTVVASDEEQSSSSAADVSFELSAAEGDGDGSGGPHHHSQDGSAPLAPPAPVVPSGLYPLPPPAPPSPAAAAATSSFPSIRVDDLLSTSPPPPNLSLSPYLSSTTPRRLTRPDAAPRSPSEERVKSGGYISLYKRADALLTASAYARVSPSSPPSSTAGERRQSLSEDDDNDSGGSAGTRGTSPIALAIPSKVTTCVVVFS